MYTISYTSKVLLALVFAVVAVFGVWQFAYAETEAERRLRLENELARIEAEIQLQEILLDQKSGERRSLERDVAVLDAEINKAQLGIRQRNLTISQIQDQIQDSEEAVRELDGKLQRERSSLARLLRKTNEIDDLSFAEMLLGTDDLSDIFTDLDSFQVVKISLADSFEDIAQARLAVQGHKEILSEKQSEEEELRQLQLYEQELVEERKNEKDEILQVTKGQEEVYQEIIQEKRKSAAEIRSVLFALRGTSAIPFGDAYDFAKEAGAATGVRPALILAILKQETNLGENIGQCLLTNDPEKGDGKGKNTGRLFKQVMKPTRDVDPFMEITAELGIDPFNQVVSCPPSYGFGGAMGPSQFIPSTWMLYKDRIAQTTGQNPPSPWEPRTAIFATALLMADNGADGGTRASERLAALRYFAGWRNAQKPQYAFYGDGVMGFVDDIQADIDILEGR